MTATKRKGSRSVKDIPANILQQLNAGKIETANLVEWLAIDQKLLVENVLTHLKRKKYLQLILAAINNLKKQTVTTVNEAIGLALLNCIKENKDTELLDKLIAHKADAVRCWATYIIGRNEALSPKQKVKDLQSLAADSHFGVREIAWMAIRPSIALNLNESIEILFTWAKSKDENIRRFASEATRPRGVWCEHIDVLKKNPYFAIPILETLKTDTSKYVQDSVGNWLNDASKTAPDFVINICNKWQKENPTKATDYIIKKALRSIEKL
jgi:3-methyladenine DNA glycosylase AlkC